MIELQATNLRYDDVNWVLRDVDLSVRQGEFVSLLGPSGCGKSSLLRLIAGLMEPSSGKVLVGDQPATRYVQTSQGVALVFQEPRLLPWRNVAQNIALPLELLRVPKQERQRRVDASIALVGLRREDAAKHPRMLSGGMRMRVALARALVTQPRVLLLDEPFAALDDLLRQQLNEELLRVWQQQSVTTVFVTHNISEAVFLSQRVFVMQDPKRVSDPDCAKHPKGSSGNRGLTSFSLTPVSVPFDFPRKPELRASAEFARLVGEVSDVLRTGAARG